MVGYFFVIGHRVRDFNDEVVEVVMMKDPMFKPSYLHFWNENLPAPKPTVNPFSVADEQISQLSVDARRAAWERDTLQLAKDLANLGKVFEQETRSEQAKRTQRILHIRQQNLIGASIVENFMKTHLAFHHGNVADLCSHTNKAGDCQTRVPLKSQNNLHVTESFFTACPCQFLEEAGSRGAGTLIWCDLSKLGRVSNNELNNLTDLIANIVKKKPVDSVAFLVAPVLCSEKISNGLRGERRLFGSNWIPYIPQSGFRSDR